MEENLARCYQLGKEAAYRRSYILPPKRQVTSRSRTVRVQPGRPVEEPDGAAGSAQQPYRYGRKPAREIPTES